MWSVSGWSVVLSKISRGKVKNLKIPRGKVQKSISSTLPTHLFFFWNTPIRICFSNLTLWTLCEKTDERETGSIIFILVSLFSLVSIFLFFLAFSQLNLSCKLKASTFPSNFWTFQSFFGIIFNTWGKPVIRLAFLSISTNGTVKYCTKSLAFWNPYFFFILLFTVYLLACFLLKCCF